MAARVNSFKPRVVSDDVPHDRDAEEAVIGSLLMDSAAIEAVAPILSPEDFHLDVCRLIYDAALTLHQRRVGIDYVTVTSELRDTGKLDEIGGFIPTSFLTVVPTSTHAPHYAQRVKETAKRRALIKAGSQIAKLGYEDGELDHILTQARAVVEQATEGAKPKPSETELRARWMKDHPQTVYSAGEFWRYRDRGVWERVEDAIIEAELNAVLNRAEPEGVKVSGRLLASVMRISRAEIVRPSDIWDTDPHILVCQNGVLDLHMGLFREHDPNDYATTAIPYAYDPDADAPAWRCFLAALNPDVVPFLQEYAGYCLTTDTRQELAVWLYGQPGGGKSTYIEGLRAMLGPKAANLSLRDIERSRFGLAGIRGKTLLVASESPTDYVTTTDILNAIISGETVRVEQKHKPAFDMTPRAKICWAMNSYPRIGDPNDGLFRRVKVVTFDPIPEADRDPEIKETIRAEGAGILLWGLEGLKRLRARGRFAIPQAVRDATDHFKAANDVPALFVSERCVTGPAYRVKADPFYQAYKTWCIENGYKPLALSNAAREWERLGFTRHRTMTTREWEGVGLRQEPNL